jgi:CCR4-NOT transcription complex subunit 1
MEVFPKYFRRLLQNNAAQVFSGSGRTMEPTGSYQLLVAEVQKIRQDPKQAQMIAESLDTPEGEVFKDFDVSTFMEHFKLDAVAKIMLALELKSASKSDLRTKGIPETFLHDTSGEMFWCYDDQHWLTLCAADAILTNNYQNFLMAIVNPTSDSGDDLPPSYLCALLDRLIQDPPRSWNEEHKMQLHLAVQRRYERLQTAMPNDTLATLHLSELLGPTNPLVRLVQRAGPRATSSLDSCKDMLAQAETRDINYSQVASVLLFMVISHNGQAYNPSTFVAALREHRSGKRLDWQDVVHAFDRESLSVTKTQFLALYNALLPLAQEYENFDIQLLWGGQWSQPATQLSFVVAFLSCSPDEIDASTVPRLRKAFTIEDFEDAPKEVKTHVAEAVKHPLVSLDAVKALFGMIFRSQDDYKNATLLGIPDTVINPHTDYFVLSAAAVPQPWGPIQEQAFKQLWIPFLRKRLPGYSFVFHGLWKRDNRWLASRLIEAYNLNNLDVQFIFEHAQEHGWLDALTTMNNALSLDLAAYAHGQGALDIESWLQQTYQAIPEVFPRALLVFLEERSTFDQQLLRNPDAVPSTVQLSVRTVFAFLNFLQELLPDDVMVPLLRQCIASYPRIVNYGEGFDETIDTNGKEGNALSPDADAAMQEHFKKMYNKESAVREIVEALRRYRQSEEPADQELFACMIAGLFDEYHCFAEYPPEALATTAVLFGSIINFSILSNISLRAAMAMVLEAVHADPDSNMFKFGVEALLHFKGRLSEWPRFCQELLQLRGLQTTEIWAIATDVVRNSMRTGTDSRTADQNGNGDAVDHQPLANGDGEDFLPSEPAHPAFSCLHQDPPLRPDIYEDPDEDVQDKVLFILNNVSERNLSEKLKDLKQTLEDKHHQWFAAYLVEERAKLQPNFQQLYLDMLQLFGDKMLWAEVLRETYVSSIDMLNADTTLNSSSERNHLKNLGSWLGALTLARDKPIKHRNISFRQLLVEAYQTSRLVPVIPFVCKVLIQAAKSKVFKPPNPWTIEILRILMELYHHADMKLNQKFEVEVLCQKLDLDFKTIEPSTIIRDSVAMMAEEECIAGMPDITDGFGDLALGLTRSRTQLSQAQIASRIPDISTRLYYPAISNPGFEPDEIRQAFANAAQSAITEIIFPVVERSVTIAAISTRELVVKDYATEPDETKFRTAAHNLVKNLAGSLAHVTCREPLRMAMTNNIRMLSRQISNDGLPEGVILMFVNDNIDIVCKVVEENAEEQSIAEIDRRISEDIATRQSHKSARIDEPFVYPSISKWASCIPEPFRPSFGSLKPEQLAIYEDFSPARAISGPLQTPVADTARVSDMPNDQYPSIPSLPTPAGEPAVLRTGSQRLPPVQQAPLNGYMEPFSPQERIVDLFSELMRAVKDASEEHIKDLSPGAAIREIYGRLIGLIENIPSGPQRDALCLFLLQRVTQVLFGEPERRLEVEVLVQLLIHVSNLSAQAGKQINMWLASLEDERILNPVIAPSLVNASLLATYRLDTLFEKAIQQRKPYALEFFDRALDELLLSRQPLALRTELVKAIEALVLWIMTDLDSSETEQAKSILNRLEVTGTDPTTDLPRVSKADEYDSIFDSWIQLARSAMSDDANAVASFILQLHKKGLLKDKEEASVFFRACIETCIIAYEDQASDLYGGNLDTAYIPTDSLARLLIALVIYQDEDEGAVKANKAGYLDSILSLIVVIQAYHQQTRGERMNQKVFYRLYSSIMCELTSANTTLAGFQSDCWLVIGKALLTLQPAFFQSFAFSWLGLVAHRLFMPAMLRMTDQAPWDMYARLIEILLAYAGDLVKQENVPNSATVFYRAVVRLLLVLHHDFPEFISENHMTLTNAIPAHCTQLRNVVLSAYPSSMAELPDPFTAGLKIDRIEEIRRQPIIRADIPGMLKAASVDKAIESLLTTSEPNEDDFKHLCQTLHASKFHASGYQFTPVTADIPLIHAVVLHIGLQAIGAAGSKGPTYNKSTPHAKLLRDLTDELGPEARYHLLGSMITQLRYPNSHTHYFSYAILDIFGQQRDDSLIYDIREQITRILLERLIVHRPHPWGLIVLLLELAKNQNYHFWELPFVKANPEVSLVSQQ